jgi:hypothetical protein
MTKKALIQEIADGLRSRTNGMWSGLPHRKGNMHWIYKTCLVIVDKPLHGFIANYRTLRYDSAECTKGRLKKIIKLIKQ